MEISGGLVPPYYVQKTGVLAKAIQRIDVWEFWGGGYPQTMFKYLLVKYLLISRKLTL